MKHKIFATIAIIVLLFQCFGMQFFNINTARAEDLPELAYTIPSPQVQAYLVGEDQETAAVQVFWNLPEDAEPDAYGFILCKAGPVAAPADAQGHCTTGQAEAANYYPSSSGFSDLTDSGYYYDEAVAENDTYTYLVKAYDRSGVESDFGQASVAIKFDFFKNIQTPTLDTTTTTVTWDAVSEASNSTLEYGTTTDYGQTKNATATNTAKTSFKAVLSGLSAKTLYHFRLKATKVSDSSEKKSDDQTFTTLSAPPDGTLSFNPSQTTYPSTYLIGGVSYTTLYIYTTVANLDWTATDPISEGYIEYGIERHRSTADRKYSQKIDLATGQSAGTLNVPVTALAAYVYPFTNYAELHAKIGGQWVTNNLEYGTGIYKTDAPNYDTVKIGAISPAPCSNDVKTDDQFTYSTDVPVLSYPWYKSGSNYYQNFNDPQVSNQISRPVVWNPIYFNPLVPQYLGTILSNTSDSLYSNDPTNTKKVTWNCSVNTATPPRLAENSCGFSPIQTWYWAYDSGGQHIYLPRTLYEKNRYACYAPQPAGVPSSSASSETPTVVSPTPLAPVSTVIGQDSTESVVNYLTTPTIIASPDGIKPIENFTTQVEYGTLSSKFSQTTKPITISPMQSPKLENLKSRTYYYRIATTDEKGNKTYSQEYKLKHGNLFLRFFGDRWEWLKNKVHRQDKTTKQGGLYVATFF